MSIHGQLPIPFGLHLQAVQRLCPPLFSIVGSVKYEEAEGNL